MEIEKEISRLVDLNDKLLRNESRLIAENARLKSIIDEANAQEPAIHIRDNGEMEYNPNRSESIYGDFFASPIPAQQSVDRQTIIDILVASGNLSEGVTADLIISAICAQQSPAVAVTDYKEELFQLRQQAENWSTKLGFIASAINSRKISLSDKEREFPHLLIERLHTDSELLKQRSDLPRITE